jgi:hypothetical protein
MKFRVPPFTVVQIPILLLIKVMRICEHRGLQTLHGSVFSLSASNASVHGPLWLHFEHPHAAPDDFDEDPDPAFDFDADPDLGSQNGADPQHCFLHICL